MNQLLVPGQIVYLEGARQTCGVEDFLGGGGQGEVYRASFAGQSVALKWYFPTSATQEQYAALKTLVQSGQPGERFLWPLDIARSPDVYGFGYIMPLREARFRSLVDLMRRRVEPSFYSVVTAGIELAHSFLQVHLRGLCYRDISFGNVFFDPENGDVLICDNDNVAVDGGAESGILGTPRFMAPEVVRGEILPNTQSDLFSLAVLLFYLLVTHHPLEGRREAAIRCFDLPAMNRLYGTNPLFIFDPRDDSNAPVAGYHDNALAFWPLYPRFLRDLFTRSFTEGLQQPSRRVRESEWRMALVRLRDCLLYCASCGAENFYDVATHHATGNPAAQCWLCHNPLRLPARLNIEKQTVFLNHNTRLYPHHTDPHRANDFTAPVAEVRQHPTNPDVWGLANLSPDIWQLTTAEGVTRSVEPGRSATIAAGAKIHFGDAEGEIVR